jgi:hypothetical protein
VEFGLTLGEQHRLRMYENGLLSRIFGPKREEETRELRRLLNVELHHSCSSPNIIMVIKSRRRSQ